MLARRVQPIHGGYIQNKFQNKQSKTTEKNKTTTKLATGAKRTHVLGKGKGGSITHFVILYRRYEIKRRLNGTQAKEKARGVMGAGWGRGG